MALGPVVRGFSRLGAALMKPAIPELAERGTAAAPAVLEKAFKEPFPLRPEPAGIQGPAELEGAIRATEYAPPSLEDRVHHLKVMLGSFFRGDPDLPKDIQKLFYKGRWRNEAAVENADKELTRMYESLKTNPQTDAAYTQRYLVTADNVAQALRSGQKVIEGQPIEKWQNYLTQLEQKVKGNPEITETVTRRRALWDKIFEDMVTRGWTVPKHYLEDYTPIRKIHAVADGLASVGGEELRAKYLPMMKHRTAGVGSRETNLIAMERQILADYFRKVAEHETFADLLADPTINFTDKFQPGDKIPKGLAIWRPGPGMVGYTRKASEGYFTDGFVEGLEVSGDQVTPNGYVFPRPVVEALERFNPKRSSKFENGIFKLGRAAAWNVTVGNPRNTTLNLLSDLPMALMGLPGEAAHPIGVLKWAGKAYPAAFKGAFGKGNTLVKIGNQVVDVWDLAKEEALTTGTIVREVSGATLPEELSRLTPQTQAEQAGQALRAPLEVLQKSRLAIEAAPRIAAGLDAFERTGLRSEFGRLGRESTLTYGAGAPLASRLPVIKFISPFIQFMGLASARVFDMLRAPESRNRMIAGLAAPHVMAYMWNNQNEEYKEVENSLNSFERSQLHVIVPGADPATVRRDITGKPVVFRFRFWTPEAVMQNFGLGNLASRVSRVRKGRETVGEFLTSIPREAAENISDFLFIPSVIREVATGKTPSGREIKWPEEFTRLLPITRPFSEAAQAAKDYGPVEAVKRFGEEMGGASFATVRRRGETLQDVDVMDARRGVKEAKQRLRVAITNLPPSKVKEARKEMEEAIKKLHRILAAREKK